MKKKLFATLLAGCMAASMVCGITTFAATADELPVEAEFEPNADYYQYTVVEYTIEDLSADLVVTVSANEDLTEFEILCNFYGDDQQAVATYDGSEYTITADKTGFMSGDTPAILDKAIEQDIWVVIGDEAATDADATASDAAGELPAEPEFDPNTDYDVYTVVEYTIEDLSADLVVTVSAKEDMSEFEILCNFYGDDQQAVATYDGSEYTITTDKTGFMSGDTPAILDKAIEQDIWLPIE